jgi:hypothetical protein
LEEFGKYFIGNKETHKHTHTLTKRVLLVERERERERETQKEKRVREIAKINSFSEQHSFRTIKSGYFFKAKQK